MMERIHIERQIIELATEISDGGVGVSIEGDEGIDEIPDAAIIRVEYMRSVAVNIDAFYPFASDIAAHKRAFVYHEAAAPVQACHICERGAIEAGAHNQIIVFL